MENRTANLNQNDRKIEKSTLPWLVLGLIVIGIALFNLWLVFNKKPNPTPEVATTNVPEFSLINQQGHKLTLSDLKGKVWVADFIFTNCPTICPKMTQEMANLQSEFNSQEINFVSFTVDPDRDTTDVLLQYANRYGAEENRWHFLTGNKEQIYQLANKGFKLAAAYHEGMLPHSRKFVLVTPDAEIYGYYDSHQKSAMKRLRKDADTLLGS